MILQTSKTKPKKSKTKKLKAKKKLEDLVNPRQAELTKGALLSKIPELPVTDQANAFIAAVENLYSLTLSSSLAAAIVEAKLLDQVSEEDLEDAGREVEDRFDKEKYLQLQQKLLELRAIKDLGVVFGLDQQVISHILSTRVEVLFGSPHRAAPGSPKAFIGDDPQFLNYMLKKKVTGDK